jgi:two-component system, NarL family, response regulator
MADRPGALLTKKLTVLCVDDHHLVLEGIGLIIDRQADMRVVAKASNGHEAIEQFKRHNPCVTLMDLQLGSFTGVETIRTIRRLDPAAKIIAVTTYQGDEDIHRALKAGAITYLLKDTLSDDLIRVIRQVHQGQRPALSHDVQAKLDERAQLPTITPREHEVLELIGIGMQNKEIAASLGISEETVQVHVKNILAKLGTRDRTGAVAVALRRGILHVQ